MCLGIVVFTQRTLRSYIVGVMVVVISVECKAATNFVCIQNKNNKYEGRGNESIHHKLEAHGKLQVWGHGQLATWGENAYVFVLHQLPKAQIYHELD